jgi:hypothetical protein
MHFPASQKKFVLMFLGVFATVSLIFTTWAMTRVSAWIVYHDPVWIQMSQEGATLEHGLAEAFFGVGHGGFLVIIEAVCGIAFLVLLWHTLYRHEHTSPKDAA